METQRMRLRSSVSQEDKDLIKEKAEKKKASKPFITYNGKIKYCTTFPDIALACDSLLTLLEKHQGDLIVGFDLEWPFNFVDGPGKTAVIQISPNLEVCYVFHVSKIQKVPMGLREFLENERVRLTGVNIKNDIRKLSRDFTGFNVDKMLGNAIDSGVLANTILPVTQRWSMEKLVDYVLEKRIDKSIRKSKWNVVPLSKAQLIYAAIDTYASLLLYFKLKEYEKQLEKEQNQNIDNQNH